MSHTMSDGLRRIAARTERSLDSHDRLSIRAAADELDLLFAANQTLRVRHRAASASSAAAEIADALGVNPAEAGTSALAARLAAANPLDNEAGLSQEYHGHVVVYSRPIRMHTCTSCGASRAGLNEFKSFECTPIARAATDAEDSDDGMTSSPHLMLRKVAEADLIDRTRHLHDATAKFAGSDFEPINVHRDQVPGKLLLSEADAAHVESVCSTLMSEPDRPATRRDLAELLIALFNGGF